MFVIIHWIFIGRTDAEAEVPILRPRDGKSWHVGKAPAAEKDWGQEEKGATEGEMVGWHHRLNAHEFEQTPGDIQIEKEKLTVKQSFSADDSILYPKKNSKYIMEKY